MPQSADADEGWVNPLVTLVSRPRSRISCKLRVVIASTGPRPLQGYCPHLVFKVHL